MHRSGCLRFIRSGIGIQVLADTQAQTVRRLFALRTSFCSPDCQYLVESFYSATRVLKVRSELDANNTLARHPNANLEANLIEYTPTGFDLSTPTLLTSNILPGDFVLQVTRTHVLLLYPTDLSICTSWDVTTGGFQDIDFASASNSLLLIATANGLLGVISFQASGGINLLETRQLDTDVAAISVHAAAEYCAVATMSWCTLQLFQLPELKTLLPEAVPVCVPQGGVGAEGLTVRSVALVTMTNADHLVVGLGDGRAVSFSVVNKTSCSNNLESEEADADVVTSKDLVVSLREIAGPPSTFTRGDEKPLTSITTAFRNHRTPKSSSPVNIELTDRHVLSLGGQPVELCTLQGFSANASAMSSRGSMTAANDAEPTIQTRSIFACSDRPFIIYSRVAGKLQCSAVAASTIATATAFPCSPLHLSEGAVAVSDGTSLKIGEMDALQKLHVRSLPFDRTVEAVAFHESSGLLICACPEERRVDDALLVAVVMFFDPVSMELKDQKYLDQPGHISTFGCASTEWW
eukprot:GHVT01068800.1.p1 GENE.GHVT01068800.1~~GHVT01068800.1.p1  ORF type:complete len:571 (-),score=45.86 GHVT01068800.1:1248-2813(-)